VNRRKNAAIPQGMVMMADGSLVSVNQAMGDMKVRCSTPCVFVCVGVRCICAVLVECGGIHAAVRSIVAAQLLPVCTRVWYALYGTRRAWDIKSAP
jgi:hypothetical protein